MDSSKLVVKFYADDSSNVKFDEVVPVFHSWIQSHAIPDHVLIDVADYAHVPSGPGILLVSHEANFYFDELDGRIGLTYSRKQPLPGTFQDRLKFVFRTAIEAADRLQSHPSLAGRLKFRGDLATFKINDRLFAPNTPQTFAAIEPDLKRLVGDLYGTSTQVRIEPRYDDKRLFEVGLAASGKVEFTSLVNRLASPQPASV